MENRLRNTVFMLLFCGFHLIFIVFYCLETSLNTDFFGKVLSGHSSVTNF